MALLSENLFQKVGSPVPRVRGKQGCEAVLVTVRLILAGLPGLTAPRPLSEKTLRIRVHR
jgi:hypothetical protein